jgi:hypothetical protein
MKHFNQLKNKPWLTKSVTLTSLLALTAVNSFAFTVGDSIGNYFWQMATGRLVQALALGLVIMGAIGLARTDRDSGSGIFKAAIGAGLVLAAPTLIGEFQAMASGVILIQPLF